MALYHNEDQAMLADTARQFGRIGLKPKLSFDAGDDVGEVRLLGAQIGKGNAEQCHRTISRRTSCDSWPRMRASWVTTSNIAPA